MKDVAVVSKNLLHIQMTTENICTTRRTNPSVFVFNFWGWSLKAALCTSALLFIDLFAFPFHNMSSQFNFLCAVAWSSHCKFNCGSCYSCFFFCVAVHHSELRHVRDNIQLSTELVEVVFSLWKIESLLPPLSAVSVSHTSMSSYWMNNSVD